MVCASPSSAPPARSARSCCACCASAWRSRPRRSSRSPRSARSGASSTAGWWSQPLDDETIQGFDVALFSAGATRSREWAQRFVDAGAVVVDNSSAFRMVDEVPLVVSEVNPEALDSHSGIVANPNCTTMVAMLPLKALHDEFELREMVATSYQAAGGAGQKGIDELAAQIAPLAVGCRAAVRRRRGGGGQGLALRARRDAGVQRRAAARHARRRRPHRRGAQAARRVAQDPRPARPGGVADCACACR